MHPLAVYRNSLAYHWRTNLAVMLCVVAATAALTGALLVGDSMRGSLRDLALKRLGPVDYALTAPRFIREALTDEVSAEDAFTAGFDEAVPIITLQAAIKHATNQTLVSGINLYGVDERFWKLDFGTEKTASDMPDRSVVLNRHLADELDIHVGDDVLLRIEKHSFVPTETLLGRPDDASVSVRLKVHRIIDGDALGNFSLRPDQFTPRNAFIPLKTIQRTLQQEGRANAILIAAKDRATDSLSAIPGETLNSLLARHDRLDDYHLRLRPDEQRGYFALETNRLLLEPPVEAAAYDAARTLSQRPEPVLTYLANTIALLDEEGSNKFVREIPYSTITAISTSLGEPYPKLAANEIALNQWAADDLGAGIGDTIRIEYYVSGAFGRLETEQAEFRLSAILPMDPTADPGFMPNFEGISNARTIADWDPPPSFKIDMSRIRERDEDYWNTHKGSPKAFIALETGIRLWTEANSRFGRLTAMHVTPRRVADAHMPLAASEFERLLLEQLDPAQLGLRFEPVRQRALEAGAGSTEFSGLFIGFSFFLIAAATMLVALIFRLGVERRAGEVGLLLATGYNTKRVYWLFLIEGAILADLGSALGLLGAIGYAWLMLAGLRSWWAEAVNAPFLQLHVSWMSLVIGYLASFVIALISVAWSLRGLTKISPRALLAGVIQSDRAKSSANRGRVSRMILVITLALGVTALILPFASDGVPKEYAFFGGGTALLIAGLAGLSIWLNRDRRSLIRSAGTAAMCRLGLRNAGRHRARSLLTAGLIACASFVIIAVGASRRTVDQNALAKDGGTGGFSLLAHAVVPLHYDLNTATGREALNLTEGTKGLLNDATATTLRLKPGDDASCLNLYQVTRPNILGAPKAMIARGGFDFSKTLATSPEEKANPWRLLNRVFEDGAIPAIGDANTLTWLIKLGLGDDMVVTDERGRQRKLRIVAMLAGSVLQSELVIAEPQFVELFPSVNGYQFALIEASPADTKKLSQALERDLNDHGFDVESTIDRLNEYRAVENTYMSTFQTLGGLGLILGTLGLAAVMLRNVLERRRELALLRALGHRQSGLGWMVLAENASLLIAGLFIGGLSALLAVTPHAAEHAGQIPWASLGFTLLLVLLAGLLSGIVALRSTLKTPLLPALRAE
ncbi:MAG: ABC transporter permease [Phycisphaerales bacterium]|nr:ABC transporter permease [Phycisphaerales bacterium]